jgi:hypothetical protein
MYRLKHFKRDTRSTRSFATARQGLQPRPVVEHASSPHGSATADTATETVTAGPTSGVLDAIAFGATLPSRQLSQPLLQPPSPPEPAQRSPCSPERLRRSSSMSSVPSAGRPRAGQRAVSTRQISGSELMVIPGAPTEAAEAFTDRTHPPLGRAAGATGVRRVGAKRAVSGLILQGLGGGGATADAEAAISLPAGNAMPPRTIARQTTVNHTNV